LTDLTSPALALHFARDAMGNIVALGNAPGANPATETYSYDPLYRLTGITDNGTALETVTYNPTGDRLSKTAPGLATGTYLYTTGTHQLTSIGNAAQANDANGNTTGSVMGGNTYGFAYNGRNRLTLVQLNSQTVASYTYNALGERIGKVANFPQNVSERYVYDESGQLIGEYGTTNRDYIWLGDLPVAVVDNTINGSVTTSTVNYVIADQLGTPRTVTNAAGTVIWQLPYAGNAFEELQPTSTSGYVLNLRSVGEYNDAETGLNSNGYRTRNPYTWRFGQSDPRGLDGGISTYAAVGNDPLNNIPIHLD
jgi:RHS repeat-associated protein